MWSLRRLHQWEGLTLIWTCRRPVIGSEPGRLSNVNNVEPRLHQPGQLIRCGIFLKNKYNQFTFMVNE